MKVIGKWKVTIFLEPILGIHNPKGIYMAWVRNLVSSSLINASLTFHKNKMVTFLKRKMQKVGDGNTHAFVLHKCFNNKNRILCHQKKSPLFPNFSALCKCVGQKPKRPRAKLQYWNLIFITSKYFHAYNQAKL